MKTLLASALLLFGLMSYGQRGPHHGPYKDMTPEQVATLHTKKLNLALDLTEKQQEEIQAIHLEQALLRQEKMEQLKKQDGKPSADERYALMNERLDHQLELKESMKQILSKDQFEKWEKLHVAREMRGKCGYKKGKMSR